MAEALYRKYRPQVFEDVVGQEPIERTLKNAITQDKVSHAYLFCGPRGTGKTTTARLLAKALLCETGPTPEPDGTCEDCKLIAEGAHPDVYELDAASRTGVENVREEIISRVQFAPVRGRSKIYIIDEVHMLSTAAFNALLKTLEEPPSHVVFVLCTTDPQKVPETIHSRCQRFDFRRIAPESMVSRLGAICMAEGVEFEGEALDLIAHRAEGGLRNALTSLEQIIAFENGKVTLDGAERLLGAIDSNDMAEILAYIGKRDIANCFRWTSSFVETGADLAQFVRDMAEHVRNLYVIALVGDEADLDVPETTRRELARELQWFGPDRASRLLGVLGDLSSELKTSSNPRLAFEIALTRMVRPDSDLTIESLAERIEALESGYSSVAHVLPGPIGESSSSSAQAVAAPFDPLDDVYPESKMFSSGQTSVQAAQVATHAPARGAQSHFAQIGHAAGQSDTLGQPKPQGKAAPVAEQRFEQAISSSQGPIDSSAGKTGGERHPQGKLASLANPAALQRIWQAALSTVKKKKQAYGVLFMNTKAVFDADSQTVQIVFPAESAFAFNAARKPDVQEALEEALTKAVGAPVAFSYMQAGSGSGAVARQTVAQKPVGQEEMRRSDAVKRPDQTNPPVQGQPQAEDLQGIQGGNRAHDQERQSTSQKAQLQNPAWQPASQTSQNDEANVSYEAIPYEQVPYEDMGFDQGPYEEHEAYGALEDTSVFEGDQVGEVRHASGVGRAAADISPSPDLATSASPLGDKSTYDDAQNVDAADVEAMLKASFGDGVIFQEEAD